MLSGLLNKAEGESNSATEPRSRTRTLSQSMMVLRRCAIVRTVQSRNSERIV